jgi:hypothetical protein
LLTVVDPPLSPPPLSTPAGAERGANSRIWPCFFREDVHGLGQQHVYGWGGFGVPRLGGGMGPGRLSFWNTSGHGQHNGLREAGFGQPSNGGTVAPRAEQSLPPWFAPKQSSNAQTTQPPHQTNTAHKTNRLVRPHSKHTARYGCWLPFPPRRGGSGAGGIGGEEQGVSKLLCAARRKTSCL